MFSTDDYIRIQGDIVWALANWEHLKDNERGFISDLHTQVLEYEQFMHMTLKQQAWLKRIVGRFEDEACNDRLGDVGDEAELPHTEYWCGEVRSSNG